MAKAKAKAKAILTREDVHAALLHFAELAVAFEGGGIEVVDPRAPLDVPATMGVRVSGILDHSDRLRA